MLRSLPLLAAGLAAVRAQAPNSLPQCGQTCVNNMLEIAVSDFGCDASDLASCACCNADFGYGIRDCSRQVCGDGSADYSSVISYGSSYCSSAVTTCPSGTQATTVLATATTGSGNDASVTASSGASSTPSVTSGPLAAAVDSISNVSGNSNAYAIGQTTISAGGDAYSTDGTGYTVLPGGAGLIVSSGNARTTYIPEATNLNNSTGMSTMAGGSGGALGAAAGSVSPISGSPNQYQVGDETISAGGDDIATDGTTYTALPSNGGVQIIANGQTTTANPASASASTTSSSGSSSTTGGSGGGAGSSQDSGNGSDSADSSDSAGGNSGNSAPLQTAAPALIGAAAMAILAL